MAGRPLRRARSERRARQNSSTPHATLMHDYTDEGKEEYSLYPPIRDREGKECSILTIDRGYGMTVAYLDYSNRLATHTNLVRQAYANIPTEAILAQIGVAE